MDIIYLFTQITGILGIGVFMTCFHFKNMKNVLSVKLATDVIWATHYLLLAAYAGFFTNVICIFRELIFMDNDKNIFKSKIWLAVFVIANITAGILSWQGFYSIIPELVSSMATFSFWQKNVNTARKIAAVNNILMFIYDVFVLSYAGMVAETLAFVSVLIALIKNKSSKSTAC